MSEPKHGIVYFITNPAMLGLVKIGQTTNEITNRLNELNTNNGDGLCPCHGMR